MIAFGHPWVLALLAPLIALAWTHHAAEAGSRRRALAYSSLAAVAPFARDVSRLALLPRALGYVGMALLIAALAQPRAMLSVPIHDVHAVVCIDTSGSMGANDFTPTRADAARAAARRFVEALPSGTRVAVVAFSTTAQVVQTPTADRGEQLAALQRIPAPNGATAIGSALATAASLLPARGRRAIVLLTDGVNNRPPDPLKVAREIGKRGVVVDTVGIGSNTSTATIPGTNEIATFDAAALRAIAADAHGSYAQASDARGLAAAFVRLARGISWERRPVALTEACAAAALLALAAGALGGAVMLRG
ncbi:MAG TPA: VWA domain-containing protein [Candidatus Dormibacteraeota bacterium]|nr:VWA domain-containing protein [Candidatus Dormibacteraeota bacterium]